DKEKSEEETQRMNSKDTYSNDADRGNGDDIGDVYIEKLPAWLANCAIRVNIMNIVERSARGHQDGENNMNTEPCVLALV
ncbi:hypothetical protein ACJMK2_035390, partial [Sinanodonta woodiana]